MKKESFFSSVKGLFSNREVIEKKDTVSKFKQNSWGMSGRVVQMQTRSLMQLKGFERK